VGRTNVFLDDDLVEKAMKVTGARTKRQVVHEALRKLVEDAQAESLRRRLYRKACKGLLELEGIGWHGDLRTERRDRTIDIRDAENR
jgi:Arc/MetJ family transcription regulator